MIRRPFGATGARVPVVGQGTWRMGESRHEAEHEVAALRLGIELGLVRRESLFIVTKVLPSNASYEETLRACEGSVKRLGVDYVDVYLLHWWGSHPIAETMRAMETLVRRGLTRFIGVSNFNVAQMREAQAALRANRLACDQVLYHLRDRGIETDLLPYRARRRIAVVGYTPLARGGFMRDVVARIARKHGRTPRQVALNFLTRRPALFTIPKASRPEHVRENAAALDFTLTPRELAAIDRAFRAG